MGQGHVTKVALLGVNSTSTFASDVMCAVTMCVDGLMVCPISRYSISHTFYLGMYGQLGHGDSEKQSAAKMVKALEGKVVYLLACGNFHTVRAACSVLLYRYSGITLDGDN